MLSRPRSLALLGILLAAAQVLLDSLTAIPLNVSILYGVPLVIVGLARKRRMLWVLTVLMICATFVVYSVQIPAGTFSLAEPLFINRLLAASELLLTAVLLHLLIDAVNKLEERARADREASERKTRLLASVSHDIHTPLTAINLMADMIQGLADRPAAQIKELARNLQASALVLTKLVADVLDVSYFESGQVSLRESEFSLDELVAQECAQLSVAAEAKGLRLEIDRSSRPLCLFADRVKLARSLRNLLSNAIKFTSKGAIDVRWSLSGDGDALIQVRDSGCGIAPDDLNRIFAEFARLGEPVREQSGWGLGLHICRRLVGLMGGSITVESRLNEGSTFTIRLPPSRVRN